MMSALSIAAPASERLMTAEEFLAQPDDGRRTELVRGRIVELPPTNFLHGVICSKLVAILNVFVSERNLGWVLCNDSGVITRRNPDSVRSPDVSFFSYQRIPKESPPEGYPEAAPELVFEVRSPSDRWQAITAKAGEISHGWRARRLRPRPGVADGRRLYSRRVPAAKDDRRRTHAAGRLPGLPRAHSPILRMSQSSFGW